MSVRQRVSRQSVLTAKCPYGEVSLRRSVLTAKCPYGEVSLRRSVLTAKCPYGEVSVRRSVRTANCPTVKCPSAKSLRAKSPGMLQTVDPHPTQQQCALRRGCEPRSDMFEPARSMRWGQCSGLFLRRKDTGKIAFVVPYFQERLSKRRPFYKQPLVWQWLQRIRGRRLCIYYATAFR